MDSVRSVALGFWIGTGSVTEDEPEAGLSHLLEHMLFRGTDRYGSLEIDQLFDAMGAELNAGTGKETTSVYARVLDVHLPEAFDVMHEMVWKPRIAAEDLDNERQIVLEEIAMYEDDPQDKVFDVLGQAIFGGHPLGRAVIGYADVVAGSRADVLKAFHAQRYGPHNVVLAAAGSIDHDALVELALAADAAALPAVDRAARPAAARRAGGADAVHPQGHRAVPRVPRRAGHRPRRRPPLGAAGPRQRARRHVVLPAVPGGARAPGPGLQRLLVQRAARGRRAGRPLRRHATRQRRRGHARRRPPSSSASSPTRSPPRSWPAPRRTSRGAPCSRWSPRPRG